MLENEYSKVKVNNEIDFCSVTDEKVKLSLEKEFMKANVSYFLRWDYPGFLEKIFGRVKPEIVFCINSAHVEEAEAVVSNMTKSEGEIKIICTKSHNKLGF